MFELKYIGPTASDCTAPYAVDLNGEYTVEEFIKDVISDKREWGYIGIHNDRNRREEAFGSPHCEYKHGELLTNLPSKYLTKKVISAKASGGWSRMDYWLTLEESDTSTGILWYAQRRQLANSFERWCETKNLAKTNTNFVAFLLLNGLLNEDKTLEFLKGETK